MELVGLEPDLLGAIQAGLHCSAGLHEAGVVPAAVRFAELRLIERAVATEPPRWVELGEASVELTRARLGKGRCRPEGRHLWVGG
jgi:hypothetical protein